MRLVAIAALVGLTVFGSVAQARAEVLRCVAPADAAGEGFELVVREDLGVELRLSGAAGMVVCPLRLTSKRYCPECHVPLLDIQFAPRGGCHLGASAPSGLRSRIVFHARLHRDKLEKTSLVYQSQSVLRPCALVEFEPERLGFPKELAPSN